MCFTVAVLRSLETVHGIAPALWAFEVASVLSTAERMEAAPVHTAPGSLWVVEPTTIDFGCTQFFRYLVANLDDLSRDADRVPGC
jgi:hypothetical protein